jgi:hypothetical protein
MDTIDKLAFGSEILENEISALLSECRRDLDLIRISLVER